MLHETSFQKIRTVLLCQRENLELQIGVLKNGFYLEHCIFEDNLVWDPLLVSFLSWYFISIDEIYELLDFLHLLMIVYELDILL